MGTLQNTSESDERSGKGHEQQILILMVMPALQHSLPVQADALAHIHKMWRGV